MVRIDGVRYITQKKYSELTGIHQSRISQIKSTLPIDHIEGLNMDLINYDMVELQEDVRKSFDREIATKESIIKYSLPELGNFFQVMIYRLMKEAETAQQQRLLADDELRNLKEEKLNLVEKILELQEANASLERILSEKVTKSDKRTMNVSDDELKNTSLYMELKHELLIQNEINENLKEENISLRFAIKSMERLFNFNPDESDELDSTSRAIEETVDSILILGSPKKNTPDKRKAKTTKTKDGN